MSLKDNHTLFMELNQRKMEIEPHFNPALGKYSDVLLTVNGMLCYILQVYDSPHILSDTVLTDTDFIIAMTKLGPTTDFYIIPSDFIHNNKESYALPYADYKDAWDYLTL